MLAVFSRAARALTLSGALVALGSSASGQFYDPCNICAPTAMVVQPVAVAVNPCPCLQPVTETVMKEVPVTKYRAEARTVQKPIMRTVYEERPYTAYRPVTETRVAEVPGVTYQNVTECQPVTVNRSYWRTAWQPVPKMHPVQYDPSPTLLGEFNRWGYATRMALTPNYIPRREFVPNVTAYNVPVTRSVAVPTTRQVTYNVTKLEPYQATRTVAVQKLEYVEQTVTAYVPYTEMRTVAVPTTRYAFVDPLGTTATVARPTPAERTAEAERIQQRKADASGNSGNSNSESSGGDGWKLQSYPQPKSAPTPAAPGFHDARNESSNPAADVAHTTAKPAPTVVQVAGWRARRPLPTATPATEGPALSVAAK